MRAARVRRRGCEADGGSLVGSHEIERFSSATGHVAFSMRRGAVGLFPTEAFHGGDAGPDRKVRVMLVGLSRLSWQAENHEQSLCRVLTEM